MDGTDYRALRKEIKKQEKLNRVDKFLPRKSKKFLKENIKGKFNESDQSADEVESEFEEKKDIKIPKFDYKIYDYHFCKEKERLYELKEKKHKADYLTMKGQASLVTDEDLEEIKKIEQDYFLNWNRKEFQTFIRKTAELGRHETEKISKAIGTKTPEEVEKYSKHFWMNLAELESSLTKQRTIECGEFKILKKKNIWKCFKNG